MFMYCAEMLNMLKTLPTIICLFGLKHHYIFILKKGFLKLYYERYIYTIINLLPKTINLMKKILTIIILFSSFISFGQNLQNANWCFRISAKVDFNLNPPNASSCVNNSTTVYGGSGASVSNSNGQLLFYTDGISVRDRNNNIMPNGYNIGGGTDPLWNQQTCIIVPKPNSANLYYIFVVNKFTANLVPPVGYAGLHYSIVDMCANGGNGEVVMMNGQNNLSLKNHSGTIMDYDYSTNSGLQIFESRISSTLNDDKTKVWVSFFTRFNVGGLPQRYAYQYLVTENGINSTSDGTSPSPTTYLLLNNANFPPGPTYSNLFIGALKFSPDGNYACDANDSHVSLYNFDKQNGILSFNKNVYNYVSGSTAPGYGVEFSPNSQLLYFSTWDDKIYQDGFSGPPTTRTKKYIRVRQQQINSDDSAIIVGEFEASPPRITIDHLQTPIPASGPHGDLQLAINNKIYVCGDYTGTPQNGTLDAILYPDVPGLGCTYSKGYLALMSGTEHEGSLPQWVHKTIFSPIPTCPGAWPKIYANQKNGIFNLVNDKQGGNCIIQIPISNTGNTINHNGTGFPTLNDRYLIQYNKTTGLTTWVNKNESAIFALNSGDVETTIYGDYYYKNASNGNLSSPPIPIPTDEVILAEHNGTFITCSIYLGSSTLNVHTASSTNSISLPSYGINNFKKAIFNPISKKLFIHYYTSNPGPGSTFSVLAVYLLNSNNTLSLINTPFATIGVFSNLALANTSDEVFSVESGVLQKYNYANNTYYPPLGILGFFNNNLTYLDNVNQTVEDKILVFNTAQNRIYAINTVALTQRKITVISNANYFFLQQCFFDNSDVFLTGWYNGGSLIIGNQVMYPISANSAFITKFNLTSDFSFTSNATEQVRNPNDSNLNSLKNATKTSSIELVIVPNPVKDYLQLKISSNKTGSPYFISITNSFGLPVFNKKTYDNYVTVNVDNLLQGIYYVTVSTDKDTKATKTFTKQ